MSPDDGGATVGRGKSCGAAGSGAASLPRHELRAALAGTGIAARYQPVVRMLDRRPVSLEVLARLDHPLHGVLAPEHFVPQMEDAGLARLLTESVAALAFGDYTRHLDGLGLTLALNFPLDVLLDCAAVTALDAQREAAGIPAAQVLVELTERRPLDTRDAAEVTAFGAAMLRLRTLGYGLAIDDVGPDTTNLRVLLDCGFTALKLDRSVVEDSGASPAARGFLREAVAAARAAGLAVIAEGVEDEAGWQRMQEQGVDQVQGYLISRPLSAAAIGGWLQQWRLLNP